MYQGQLSNVRSMIMKECKQILMFMRYGVRSNLSFELLSISLTLELFQNIHGGFLKWLHYPK